MVVTVKVSYKGDVRRFSLDPATYAELHGRLVELYRLPLGFRVLYHDEDGDAVHVTCDMELAEALTIAAKTPPFRIYIEEKQAASITPQKGSVSAVSDVKVSSTSAAAVLPNNSAVSSTTTETKSSRTTESGVAPAPFQAFTQMMGARDPVSATAVPPQALSAIEQLTSMSSSQLGNLTSSTMTEGNAQLFNLFSGIISQMPKEQMTQILTQLMGAPMVQQILSGFLLNMSGLSASRVDSSTETQTQTTQAPVLSNMGTNTQVPPVVHNGTNTQVPPVVHNGTNTTMPDVVHSATSTSSEPVLPKAEPEQVLPTAELKASFLKDMTLEDEVSFPPHADFVKIWKMQNIGTSAWPQGCRIAWDGGDGFAHKSEANVAVTQAGHEVDIALHLCAPKQVGTYVTYWRLVSPSNQKFGPRLWFTFKVEKPKPKSQQEINLEQLVEMGFADREQNLRLLNKHKQDLSVVIQELLNGIH